MAQLMAFQLPPSARKFSAEWQHQQKMRKLSSSSSAAAVRMAVSSLRIRSLAMAVTAPHAAAAAAGEELSPKERHHLRKKEDQKRIRKIRKERRVRRREEELAKIPKVKVNPALQKFKEPLADWNKPWKQRKKKKERLSTAVTEQASAVRRDSGAGERSRGTVGRDWHPEWRNSYGKEISSALAELDSEGEGDDFEFEAMYEEKLRNRADRIANEKEFVGPGDQSAPLSPAHHGRGREISDRKGEFRAEFDSSKDFAKGPGPAFATGEVGALSGEGNFLDLAELDSEGEGDDFEFEAVYEEKLRNRADRIPNEKEFVGPENQSAPISPAHHGRGRELSDRRGEFRAELEKSKDFAKRPGSAFATGEGGALSGEGNSLDLVELDSEGEGDDFEFEAVYEEKLRNRADRFAQGRDFVGPGDQSSPLSPAQHGRRSEISDRKSEFRAEFDKSKDSAKSLDPPFATGEVALSSGSESSASGRDWGEGARRRGSAEEDDWRFVRGVSSIGEDETNTRTGSRLKDEEEDVGASRGGGLRFSSARPSLEELEPSLRELDWDSEEVGEDDRVGRRRRPARMGEIDPEQETRIKEEGFTGYSKEDRAEGGTREKLQNFRRGSDTMTSSAAYGGRGALTDWDSEDAGEDYRAARRRPAGMGELDPEREPRMREEGFTGYINEDRSKGGTREKMQNFVRGSDRMTTSAAYGGRGAPTDRHGSEAALRSEAEEDKRLEISEFWDRRDMLLQEQFDGASWKEKFESSARSKKLTREQRRKVQPSREVARVVIGRRKGENVYLSFDDDDAVTPKGLPRGDLNESRQLEWLAKQLDAFGRPDGVHLSKLMRSGGLKITDGRAVTLVQRLGDLGNWRRALQVVEWLNSRNHFPPMRSRYVFTTLLAVLGKARRPIESLNVFNVMREHLATYPDMAAYHAVAVTLGRSGHMEELLELLQSLRQGPERNTKFLLLIPNQGCLDPDVVIYNAILNSCVPHKHWRCALWVLEELQREKKAWPNSASYGLAIEVMVAAGKLDLAWKTLERMELGGFHPNATTYKVMVRGLGQAGKADVAVEMVRRMEERGIVPVAGVYYALAYALCTAGKWEDAILQVDRIVKLSNRPMVETYTGLIKACKEAGHWRDAISVFERMREVCAPNIGTYNLMISIYGANRMYEEAEKTFKGVKTGRMSPRKMYGQDPRLTPDPFTYDAMLGACIISERWDDLEVLFRQMLLEGYQLNPSRHSWVLRATSLSGKDDLMAAMFNHLKGLNAATSEIYACMISSLLKGGQRNQAFDCLEEMVQKDMRISSLDLQIFREAAVLLGEEDRETFNSKVDSLTVASEFNFKNPGSSSKLQRPAPIRQSLKTETLSGSSLNGIRGHTNVMKREKVGEEGITRFPSASFGRSNGVALDLSLFEEEGSSPVRSSGYSEGLEGGELEGHLAGEREREMIGTVEFSEIPGWELLWKQSRHGDGTSNKFQISEQVV